MAVDWRVVGLLAALSSLGPFAMQSVAPALPMVADSLNAPVAAAQSLISLSALGIGVATLFLGALSDQYGRRPVMLGSIGLAVAASLAVAVAPTMESAAVARFVQAGACGAGMVLGRAVARDLYGPEGAGKVIAQVTAVMVLAPMIAPMIGGVIAASAGWRAIFVATAVYGAAMGVWAWASLRESLQSRTATGARELARGLAAVARLRAFWRYGAVGCFSLSSFLMFVGVAPYVAAVGYGAGPDAYGYGFVVVAAGYITSNLLYARLSGRVSGDVLMVAGLAFSCAGALGCALAMAAGWRGLETVFAPALLNALGSGLVVPNASAGAVSSAPGRAGAASSLLGFSQFAVAALFTQLGASLPHGSAAPMSLAMAGLSAAALAGHFLFRRPEGAVTV